MASCGCLKAEISSALCKKMGAASKGVTKNLKHGHSRLSTLGKRSATYTTWRSMISRTTNPNVHNYKNYGGRGITVCDRWFDFKNFLKDMGEKPVGLTLERIDNNKGYEPGNCRWATWKEQAANRRPARKVVVK